MAMPSKGICLAKRFTVLLTFLSLAMRRLVVSCLCSNVISLVMLYLTSMPSKMCGCCIQITCVIEKSFCVHLTWYVVPVPCHVELNRALLRSFSSLLLGVCITLLNVLYFRSTENWIVLVVFTPLKRSKMNCLVTVDAHSFFFLSFFFHFNGMCVQQLRILWYVRWHVMLWRSRLFQLLHENLDVFWKRSRQRKEHFPWQLCKVSWVSRLE